MASPQSNRWDPSCQRSPSRVTAASGDPSVRWAQEILQEHRYYIGAVDGRMGAKTRSALRQFQLDRYQKFLGRQWSGRIKIGTTTVG